jgi:hypothetical protein
MSLIETSNIVLQQIKGLLIQMQESDFIQPVDILEGNSIGKHIRHILEFFNILADTAESGVINYDKREHNIQLESNLQFAITNIETLLKKMYTLPKDRKLILEVRYGNNNDHNLTIESNIERELAYNIEHAIHHMAIIKIALLTQFHGIQPDKNFGTAFSTIRFRTSQQDKK